MNVKVYTGIGLSILVICFSCLMFFHGCSYLKDIPDDNPVEEVAEEFIEEYFDLPDGSVDLTPSSPEK